MESLCLPLGAYQTNCYLVWKEGSDRCVVIDPGYQPEKVLEAAARLNKSVAAVLLTHGHFDHVGGVKQIAEETGCPVYLDPRERTMPAYMTNGELYSTHSYPDRLEVAGLTFLVLSTPGHTPGSVCLLCEETMFSGDTLFAGSCGRTDLPGGDSNQIRSSLKMLAGLEKDYRVLPGHGEASTLRREILYNPYM